MAPDHMKAIRDQARRNAACRNRRQRLLELGLGIDMTADLPPHTSTPTYSPPPKRIPRSIRAMIDQAVEAKRNAALTNADAAPKS